MHGQLDHPHYLDPHWSHLVCSHQLHYLNQTAHSLTKWRDTCTLDDSTDIDGGDVDGGNDDDGSDDCDDDDDDRLG